MKMDKEEVIKTVFKAIIHTWDSITDFVQGFYDKIYEVLVTSSDEPPDDV